MGSKARSYEAGSRRARGHTHHPHGRDGPLVVLKGHQLQVMNGEEHQPGAGHQQGSPGSRGPSSEVRRHHGVWQQEARNLSYF